MAIDADILDIPLDSVEITEMRIHELALQNWLNKNFVVREGYPVPVVFSSPMDAFGYFQNLWADENNPFNYLLRLKDENGKPAYEPHPAAPRLPIISAHRKGWTYNPQRSTGYRRNRHVVWPTISEDVAKRDLHSVVTALEPAAWDFKFQIDHFCRRPDTQARFLHQFMRTFAQSGAILETWMPVAYPTMGLWPCRVYVDGEPANLTPEEVPPEEITEYRTSIPITIEGWSPDVRPDIRPAAWTFIAGSGTADPQYLSSIYAKTTDSLRDNPTNDRLLSRPDIPEA